MAAFVIGILVALVAVLTVVAVYKYKSFYKPETSRIVGVSFVAIMAPFGAWALKEIHGGDIPTRDAIIFAVTGVLGLVVFFWLFRKRISEGYYE